MASPADGVAVPGMLLGFLERASIAYAGTRDSRMRPAFHWVCGWRAESDPRLLAFFVARPFATGLLENVARSPRLALTVEHIGPHETYQFKGEFAGSHDVDAADRATAERCRQRFVEAVLAIDTRHGFSAEGLDRYMGEPALTALLRVQEVFRQTPGPGAGCRLVPPEPQ